VMKRAVKPDPFVKISRVVEAQRVIEDVDASKALIPLLEMRDVIEQLTRSKKLKPGSIPSPRALQRLIGALKVAAMIRTGGDENTHVEMADLRTVAVDFFRHRIYPARDDESLIIEKLIKDIVDEGIEHSVQITKVRG